MGEKDIKTSFQISGDLWKKARIYAIKNDMTMKELLENLLKTELEKNTAVKKGERE